MRAAIVGSRKRYDDRRSAELSAARLWSDLPAQSPIAHLHLEREKAFEQPERAKVDGAIQVPLEEAEVVEIELRFLAQPSFLAPAVEPLVGHDLQMGLVEDAHRILGPVALHQQRKQGLDIAIVGDADDDPAARLHGAGEG